MSTAVQPAPKEICVSALSAGSQIDCILHLVSIEQRTKKNGDPFFMLQLGDATGAINGIMWDNHAHLISGIIVKDDFVRVGGDVGEFNGTLQITLKRIARVDDTEIDLARFLPTSPRNRAEMEAELDAWIAKVQNKDCKRLLAKLFGHKRMREMYCTCPAAVRIHQAYVHGLLEHTLNVVKIANNIADLYEPIDRDILITGALLHDIGKIRELDWKRTITYTTEGRLLGHIPMGATMIDSFINELRRADGFDEQLQMQLIHLILSHHGKLEYGSPVRPQTREAYALHYADNTEAYMTVFAAETQKAADRGQAWTNFNKMFDSYLYAGNIPKAPVPSSEDLLFQPEGKPQPADDVYPAR